MKYKTLQKNIYQHGTRIYVKKTVYSSDKEVKKVMVFPCKDFDHAVQVLEDLVSHDCSMTYAIELEKKCRVECGLPELKNGKRDESNIYLMNKKYYVVKEIDKKRLSWKCESHEEARLLRDKLRENNWSLPADTTHPASERNNKQKYSRFEEVKELPRIHIPKKPTETVEKPKEVVEKPKDNLILDIANRYNMSYEDMSQLCIMIGLQQLNKLNFIPEYEE